VKCAVIGGKRADALLERGVLGGDALDGPLGPFGFQVFGGEAQLRDLLTGAVAAVPAGTRPLPTLRAAFHQAVPLIERNLPVTERRMPVIVATPALKERALAKSAALVAALTDALQARGVAEPLAALCAQVGMDTYSIAIRRWRTDRTDDLHTHLDRAFTDLRLAANALK
jgi:hypothetical protein